MDLYGFRWKGGLSNTVYEISVDTNRTDSDMETRVVQYCRPDSSGHKRILMAKGGLSNTIDQIPVDTMSNTLDQIPVDKTWSPVESDKKTWSPVEPSRKQIN